MISAPHDYGLTPGQTLEHVADVKPPVGFNDFWTGIREEVETLSTHFRGTIDGPVNRVWFDSVRAVRIAGRLTLPERKPRGAVIAVHGHEVADDFEGGYDSCEPWTEYGLATLRIRVRGFPPSVGETDDLRAQWVPHNIEVAEAWIVPRAVADVMQAYRCLRRYVGEDMPINLHGVSLGAGLGVVAAAQLAAMTNQGRFPHRMVLEHPDLGDWAWRLSRCCLGPGGEVSDRVEWLRDEEGQVLRTLELADAALHACSVACPVLCKLAWLDETVPAPSAASVFNALGGVEKWRYVTRFGHYEGGLADARRHEVFRKLHPQFLNPGQNPALFAEEIAALSEPEAS